jgi:uncharacterized membrane protein
MGNLDVTKTEETSVKTNVVVKTAAIAAALIVYGGAFANAQEQPSTTQTCPIDTTKDSSTGAPRNGVQVCSDGHGGGSVGFSTTDKEIAHFLKYPIGQSDKSVAKQVGNAVHNFFHHL